MGDVLLTKGPDMALYDPAMTARITREAREIHFWRSVLTLIAGILFGLGWLVAKAFGMLWLACAWSATAVKVGWQEARKTQRH